MKNIEEIFAVPLTRPAGAGHPLPSGEGKQLSNTLIAKVEPQPREHRGCEREQRWIQRPDSNIGCDRAAQVTRKKHRTENRRTRNHVQQNRAELERGNKRKIFHLPADSSPLAYVGGILSQFPSRTDQHDENRQKRNDAAGPHHPAFPSCHLLHGARP